MRNAAGYCQLVGSHGVILGRTKVSWRALGWTIESTPDRVLLKPSSPFPAAKPADVFASLSYRGKPKSMEEMETGIAAEARRRHTRD